MQPEQWGWSLCLLCPLPALPWKYCPPKLNWTPVSSCIVWLVSTQARIDSSQIRCCCSIRPLPLVKPPLVFWFVIRTCSMSRRSIHSPAQNRSLLLAAWRPARILGRNQGGTSSCRTNVSSMRMNFRQIFLCSKRFSYSKKKNFLFEDVFNMYNT